MRNGRRSGLVARASQARRCPVRQMAPFNGIDGHEDPDHVVECSRTAVAVRPAFLAAQPGTPARQTGRGHRLPTFEWCEQIDGSAAEFSATSRRAVLILEKTASGWQPRYTPDRTPDDDQGVGLITLMREKPRKPELQRRAMVSLWVSPILEDAPPSESFKFEVIVEEAAGIVRRFESTEFSVDLAPTTRRPPLQASECH